MTKSYYRGNILRNYLCWNTVSPGKLTCNLGDDLPPNESSQFEKPCALIAVFKKYFPRKSSSTLQAEINYINVRKIVFFRGRITFFGNDPEMISPLKEGDPPVFFFFSFFLGVSKMLHLTN